MDDYCIMIVCNVGPARRHDCTQEAKPMATSRPNTLIHMKETVAYHDLQNDPKPASQGLPSLRRFLPQLVHEWKLNVLFVGALVGRPSCWVVVCIFNVHPGQCQCHLQWKANLTRVTPSSLLFPHIEALIRADFARR